MTFLRATSNMCNHLSLPKKSKHESLVRETRNAATSYNMKLMYPSCYRNNGPMATWALDVIHLPYLTFARSEQCMSQDLLLTACMLCKMDVQFKDEILLNSMQI